MKVSYKWLQSYFEKELPSPEEIEALLSVRSFEPEGIEEVNGESVLDFDVLPNRAHDALSHRGIAREYAAASGMELKTDRYSRREVEEVSDKVSVDIQNEEKCRRYVARVIKGVKVEASPDWLRERLEAIGQKSISGVVDATNYVMFDLGQPLHAFDLNKLSSGIVVRNANDGEQITTLTGEEKELTRDDLVIADFAGPLAIAGVKGGNKAGVDNGTVDIVLESANFDPLSVRQTSRRTNIQTDSSKRFENEPTREIALEAIERVTDLILDFCPDAKIGPVVDIYPLKAEIVEGYVKLDQIRSVVGVDISKEKVSEILRSLQLAHEILEGDVFYIQTPDFRLDLRSVPDLIEEVARMYGFENIPAVLPEGFDGSKSNKLFYYSGLIRQTLVQEGFFEVYTYNFWNDGEVKTLNAIASDKAYLRPSLYRGMLQSLSKNSDHKDFLGVDNLRIFEIGTVFPASGEHMALGMSISELIHNKEKIRNKGLQTLDGYLKKLEAALGTSLEPYKEGVNGGVLQINLTKLVEDLPEPSGKYTFKSSEGSFEFKNFSLQPTMTRDVSVWIPSADAKAELEEILSAADLAVKAPRLVDEFEKEGRVSYLYRLVFQAEDRTLTDNEVNAAMDPIYEKIKSHSDWELR